MVHVNRCRREIFRFPPSNCPAAEGGGAGVGKGGREGGGREGGRRGEGWGNKDVGEGIMKRILRQREE